MDILQEIFASLKQNKLRTILTGFSVAWGIFILIVLLGAGNGLQNGVMSNFADRASNLVRVWSGNSSLPYKGLKTNRDLPFSEREMDLIVKEFPQVSNLTGVIDKNQTFCYNNECGSYSLKGVSPDYEIAYKLTMREDGRFLNSLDMNAENKIIVIDQRIEDELFKNTSAIGKYIQVGSVMFRVVGVNTKKERWGGGSAYTPFTTAQKIYNPDKKFYQMAFILNGTETKAENDAFDEQFKNLMARSLSFDSEDPQAIWISNSQKDYIETMKIFNAIKIFVTVIGIFCLLAGIIGVSNIMLVSVKERTREFGIRKALGAPPASIIRSVIIEAILVTAVFGYLGMFLGMGLMETINYIMETMGSTSDTGFTVFKNPTVSMSYAFTATIILVISGIFAGYVPARRAVSIKPIEAMREE